MDRLSNLEHRLISAGPALASSAFGRALQVRGHGRRGGSDKGLSQLDMFELSAGPPVYRTFIVLDAARRTRRDLGLSAEERDYVDWVGTAQVALQAIADRFWGVIRPDIRQLVYDHDSVQVLHSGPAYIPGLRAKLGPSLHTACSRLGIGNRELSVLAECWHAAHATDAYEAARHAATRIQLHDRLRNSLRVQRDARTAEAESVLRERLLLEDAARRLQKIADAAYETGDSQTREAAEPLRAYHELVQAALWVLLGFAEQAEGLNRTLSTGLPRMAVNHGWRHLEAQFTAMDSDSFPFPKVWAPFVVEGRGLLDGIYICTGYAFHGLGEGGYIDLTGLLLRELERAPR